MIEGQLHGGATQGLGWALREAMVYDEAGPAPDRDVPRLRPARRAPTCPSFETIIVEVPSADGPYGARGIGEGPVCGAAAAVANAIAAATGVRFRTLPMTAPRVWRGIQSRGRPRRGPEPDAADPGPRLPV